MIDNDLRTAFLEYELSRAPAFALRTVGEQAVRENLSKKLDRATIAQMEDLADVEKYRELCPVVGTQPSDYFNRIVHLRGSRSVCLIPCFENLNVEKPFVLVHFSTFDVIPHLDEIWERAAFEFKAFLPKRMSFNGVPGLPDFDADIHTCASTFGALKQHPFPKNHERVALHLETNLDFYDRYAELYSRLKKNNPEHPSNQETRESLERVLNDNGLFSILVDGSWAGVFGARKESERYVHGYCVIEEILAEEYRGQHLGAALQRHAIEAIPTADETILFGTIDGTNIPSLRTAARVGRHPIYTSYWYPALQ